MNAIIAIAAIKMTWAISASMVCDCANMYEILFLSYRLANQMISNSSAQPDRRPENASGRLGAGLPRRRCLGIGRRAFYFFGGVNLSERHRVGGGVIEVPEVLNRGEKAANHVRDEGRLYAHAEPIHLPLSLRSHVPGLALDPTERAKRG